MSNREFSEEDEIITDSNIFQLDRSRMMHDHKPLYPHVRTCVMSFSNVLSTFFRTRSCDEEQLRFKAYVSSKNMVMTLEQ